MSSEYDCGFCGARHRKGENTLCPETMRERIKELEETMVALSNEVISYEATIERVNRCKRYAHPKQITNALHVGERVIFEADIKTALEQT